MPYIVTTKRMCEFATLEEARNEAETDENGRAREQLVYDEMESWEGEAITVGPLPDGTVLEVERVTWAALNGGERPGGLGGSDHEREPVYRAVLAAYNAEQEAGRAL